MNIGAFAIVITVANQGESRLQIEDYAGFGWANPMLGVFLTIFLLSLAGFPGTGGFMGKIYLLQGAADSQLWVLSVILVLTTVASYWYYLRVAWFMWMREPVAEGQHDGVTTPLPMRFALVASVALILYLGIFPSATLEFARAVNIDIGRPEDILVRANQEIFNTYMSIQKLFKERRELTRNILSAEREKGVNEAKQIAISTLSHYINNASMIIFGQSQVLRMMRQNNSGPEEIVGSLDKSLDTIDEAIRRMVAVLDEIAELNSLDDVAYFEQSKIIDIDDRINERLIKLNKLTPLRPVE